jgi:hypothetical protein
MPALRFRPSRLLATFIAALTTSFALVVVASPLTSGASVAPATTVASPPYAGTSLLVTSSGVGNSTTGCARGIMSGAPSFNTATGAFGLAIGAVSQSCPGTGSTSFNGDTVNAQGIITIPFNVASSGTYKVTLHVKATFKVSSALLYGHCVTIQSTGAPNCAQSLTYNFGLVARLADVTTGSLLASTNSWDATNYTQNSTLCDHPVCTSTLYGEPAVGSLSSKFYQPLYVSAALTATDTYAMEIYLTGLTQAESYTTYAHLGGETGTMSRSLNGVFTSISVT